MERAEDQFGLQVTADKATQTFPHLTRRLNGEGAADDILRPEALVRKQIRDS